MKFLLLVMILFISITLHAEDKQLRIIKSNGEEEIYQLSEIKHLNFEQNTYSGICKFSLTNGDSVEFAVKEINSITFKKGSEQKDSIVVNHYDDNKNKVFFISIDDIKEIVFWNKNQLGDYIFSNIEIQINGIKAEYESGTKEFNYKLSYFNTDGKGFSSFDYFSCWPYKYPINPVNYDGNINLLTYSFDGFFPDYHCHYYHTTIFIKEENKMIDSLFLTRIWRDHTAPQAGGSWRNESDYEDRLRLYSIPFEFEGESIIAEFKIDDLNKLKYYYFFKNVTGSSGGHSTSTDKFIQFLEIKDNAMIKIKID